MPPLLPYDLLPIRAEDGRCKEIGIQYPPELGDRLCGRVDYTQSGSDCLGRVTRMIFEYGYEEGGPFRMHSKVCETVNSALCKIKGRKSILHSASMTG